MSNMLEIRDLRVNFGGICAVDGISLDVEEGKIVTLIGANGAGKSTILRTVSGIVKPGSGSIKFCGDELVGLTPDKIVSKGVTLVPEGRRVFPNLTVLENITLAPVKLKLLSQAEAKKRALAMLKEINLYDKKDSYPISLSGGEKQRVAIIRTLILEPRLILLDEPTSALDPEMTKEVIELIKHLKDKGITLIIVSHEMEFVKEFSNRIIFIENGKLILDSSYNKIINGENDRVKNFIQDIEK